MLEILRTFHRHRALCGVDDYHHPHLTDVNLEVR